MQSQQLLFKERIGREKERERERETILALKFPFYLQGSTFVMYDRCRSHQNE